MAKRITEEETIIHFFQHADQAKKETVFNIVKGIMRASTGSSAPNGSGAKAKGARSKAKPATSSAAAATEGDPLPM
jgi:hypothetical protein